MNARIWNGVFKGQEYQWNQTLDEIHIVLRLPIGTRKADIATNIRPRELKIMIVHFEFSGNLRHPIVTDESTWYVEDGCLHISLQKVHIGEAWDSIFIDNDSATLSYSDLEGERKSMLIQRFQKEHPDFDFSQAEISGSNVPSAREFMGGFTV
jgi:hypothetical protein